MGAKNQEILDTVVANMPKQHGTQLEGLNGAEVLNVMSDYPDVKNSFITTLTNKVTKSLVYSKIYKNQLSELKKGKLEFGDTIEELFVQMAQVKGFTSHWDSGNTPEADLIRKLVPKVSALYIQSNVDYKGKATIMDKALRKAFLNEGGLSKLVMQIVGSITSAMEDKEFALTKATINNLISSGKQIRFKDDDTSIVTSDINTSATNKPIAQTPYIVSTGGDIKKLSQEIREATGLMKFPSTKFNLAKEKTWTSPDELVLITTPSTIANLDVNVLANAFNVSMADFRTRVIEVDEMPTGIFKAGATALVDKSPSSCDESPNKPTIDTTKKPIAILMDKELCQIWDEHQGAATFYNAEGEYTNHFANREGIFATCLFSNLAVFY